MRILNFFKPEQTKKDPALKPIVASKKAWTEPTPLEHKLAPVIKLDNQMLPKQLASFVFNQAKRFDNSSPEYVAVSCIVSAAALIGNSCMVSPKKFDKEWEVYQSLWGLIIGEPSTLKTPTISVGKTLLEYAQKTVIDPLNKEREQRYFTENKINEKKIARLYAEAEREIENGSNEKASEYMLEAEKMTRNAPRKREVVLNDVTPEALLIRLSSNPNGVLLFRDEIYGWLVKLERDDGSQERSIYTEAFNGNGKYAQERVTREPVKLDFLYVSILGGIQPGRLLPLLKGRLNGKSDDGFFERFQLSVFPDSQDEYTDVAPDINETQKMRNTFCCFAMLSETEKKLEANFTDEAQAIWTDWAKKHKSKLLRTMPHEQSVLGKYPALVARLALVFHLFETAFNTLDYHHFSPEDLINTRDLERAIKFSELLFSHNQRIQAYARDEDHVSSSQNLLSKLPLLDENFSSRDIQRKCWQGMKTAKDCQAAIDILVKHGFLREALSKNSAGKTLVRYEVHPNFRYDNNRQPT
ncbi:MAG: hypothetical protein ACI91R_002310 [Vicingaceae bacterium]|jgi:hypothetical protein